jgi:IS4 transposase
MLAFVAVLMAWGDPQKLEDRFEAACQTVTGMFPSRRRVGKTYQGFIKALLGLGNVVLEAVTAHLRGLVQQMAGAHWTREGFVAFAVDGSRVECPRTKANEEALGCGGRKGTGPQFWLTTLWHMGTALPWAWKTGPSTDAERTHLRDMLSLLPAAALLVADAGFTGYELLRDIVAGGRNFLVRVGSNVQLLKQLGYAEVEDGQTVYLWPAKFQKANQPPLVLRLIVLERKSRKKSKKMYLLTNLPADRLSDKQASILYGMRWGVELFYRSMKQTLSRRKMLSRSPGRAQAELSWTLVGLQLLGLLSVEQIIRSGKDPLSWSVATSLQVVRLAAQDSKPRGSRRGGLMGCLGRALKDRYQRKSSKKARNWPHKKKESPPGAPKTRQATAAETIKAKKLRAMRNAA